MSDDWKPSGRVVTDTVLAGVLEEMGAAVGRWSREARERVDGLEERLAALEESSIAYKGSYSRAAQYVRGDTVTHAGSLYYCRTATQDTPGRSESWVLMSKTVAK